MDLENLHTKLDSYDLLIEEAQEQWKEIHRLKPKDMNDLEFQNIIQQTRLDNQLIDNFLKNDPLKCKALIYRGANKEYLYNYVSKKDGWNLTPIQDWLLQDLHNLKKEKHFPYAYDREISDIRTITQEEYNKLLNKFDNDEEFSFDEQDCFLLKESNNEKYIAVDNTTSNMWTEDFLEKEFAERYLRGEDIEKLREEERKYEVKIYETQDDYDRGEPFQLDIYANLDEAKEELKNSIKFNHYFSGNIINQYTGREEYSYYLSSEKDKYKHIILCNLQGNNKEFEDQFLLVRDLDTLNSNFEIDLTGGFYFNCDYKVQYPVLVKTISTLKELLDFCSERNIQIPKDVIRKNGFVAGGENGMFINDNLEAIGWVEELGEEIEDFELGEQE